MRRTDQVLIFDADDTLWENNILFERAIERYLDWLAHPTLNRLELRSVIDEVEAANAATHGYGSAVFLRSLGDAFHRLNERPVNEAERDEIARLAVEVIEQRIELMPGVADTLGLLAQRHRLLLLTKGEDAEQRRKLTASGLGDYFSSVHVVHEKDESVYRRLTVERELPPTRTWMIGNSPKSDILPARAAGLNAVFIPSESTWVLEHAELDPSDTGVLTLARLTELTAHF